MDKSFTTKTSADGYIQVVEGVERKTLVYGEKTLLTEFRLTSGNHLPMHKHPHEQTGYLVSGHIVLIIDGRRHHILPGDSWIILSNVEHGAEIIKDSIAIEMFSPVREDFIPSNRKLYNNKGEWENELLRN
ncbi:MAG: cupin domain-containing protein [Clostridiales bacterium]|jgi:quercetin dioxygenase-like cupin family protein|nr:cupin domain-containing protein [Clostridiales bacterium]